MKSVAEWAEQLHVTPRGIYKAMARAGIRGVPRVHNGRKKTMLSEARMMALFPRKFPVTGDDHNLRNLLAKVDDMHDSLELLDEKVEVLVRGIERLARSVNERTG